MGTQRATAPGGAWRPTCLDGHQPHTLLDPPPHPAAFHVPRPRPTRGPGRKRRHDRACGVRYPWKAGRCGEKGWCLLSGAGGQPGSLCCPGDGLCDGEALRVGRFSVPPQKHMQFSPLRVPGAPHPVPPATTPATRPRPHGSQERAVSCLGKKEPVFILHALCEITVPS